MAPNRINYAVIQSYLEAIANNPADKGDVDLSSHGRFWQVPYQQFVNGQVPDEACNEQPIPITDRDPAKCPFYQTLKNPTGWCNLKQMPLKGPFITDPGYTVKLADGTTISGQDIDANIVWWLTNNMPEV